jgi:hypothetical protein
MVANSMTDAGTGRGPHLRALSYAVLLSGLLVLVVAVSFLVVTVDRVRS